MIKAGIIGCGNIAGFLDNAHDEHVATHAHAYKKHPKFQLKAIADPDSSQRAKFKNEWGHNLYDYESLELMLEHEKLDILSITSPTQFHHQNLLTALRDPHLKTIIAEKPFVQTQAELTEIKHLLKKCHKNIIINFIRRYDPSILKIKEMIENQALGEMLSFDGVFNKGLYHNGAHMLELIEFLCHPIHTITAPSAQKIADDLYGSFLIKTKMAKGVIQNSYEIGYSIFELQLLFSHGRIKITNSGHQIEVEKVVESPFYKGYYNLALQDVLEDTLQYSLYNSVRFTLHKKKSQEAFNSHLKLSQKLLDIRDHLLSKKTLKWGNID